VQRAVKDAVRHAGIRKRATCHTLRHSFAHPPARGRPRHPNCPGAPRSPGRQHDPLLSKLR
jgi:hypothetical protein